MGVIIGQADNAMINVMQTVPVHPTNYVSLCFLKNGISVNPWMI